MPQALLDTLSQSKPIMPVVVLSDEKLSLPLVDSLLDSGFKAVEITLRTECALKSIEIIAAKRPEMMVGAGTVLSKTQLMSCHSAGASFFVSPGATDALLECAKSEGLALIPGVASPSEVMKAHEKGFTVQKLFPAKLAGGIDFLKTVATIFPDVAFFPTGGITEDDVNDYLALPNVVCVGGSWLAPARLMETGNWTKIREILARC